MYCDESESILKMVHIETREEELGMAEVKVKIAWWNENNGLMMKERQGRHGRVSAGEAKGSSWWCNNSVQNSTPKQ